MLRVALIGCGRVAKRHAELLGGGQIDGAALVGVCDIKEERAKAFGEQYAVPCFTDMDTMMSSIDLDAVSVLTESGNHAAHVTNLARFGKHIIVEKPMALTLEDADDMIAACDANNIRLFVIKQNRFNRPVQALREALDRGRFGKLVVGTVRVRWCRPQAYYDQDSWRGTWAYDGGVLTNQASHHIDLLEWCMGGVESVYAKSATALADIETEDTAVVILKFANGALGVIEATTAARPKDLEGSLSILGEKGAVHIGGFAVNRLETWQFDRMTDEDLDVHEKFSQNPPDVYGFGHKSYYEHVVSALASDTPHLVDGLQGRKSLELINAIYESIETGKEVFLRFKPTRCKLGLKTSN